MNALVRQSALLAGRGLRRSVRTPSVLIQTLLFPGVLLLVLLAVFGGLVEQAGDRSHVQSLVPLMVITGAMFGGLGTGAALVTEREDGLLDRFRAMPVHPASALVGRLVAEVARVLIAGAALVGVGLVAGFRFTTGPAGVLGFVLVVAAVAVMFGWVVLAVGVRATTPESVTALSPLFLLLLFFNTGFVPQDAYPPLVRPVVSASPISAASRR